ncbi:MAG: hypothetical protein V9H69_24180 [Anaerolineae bacterium]
MDSQALAGLRFPRQNPSPPSPAGAPAPMPIDLGDGRFGLAGWAGRRNLQTRPTDWRMWACAWRRFASAAAPSGARAAVEPRSASESARPAGTPSRRPGESFP